MGHRPTFFGLAIDTNGTRRRDSAVWWEEEGSNSWLTVSVVNLVEALAELRAVKRRRQWQEFGGRMDRPLKKKGLKQPERFQLLRQEKTPVISVRMLYDATGRLLDEEIVEADCLVKSTASIAKAAQWMHPDESYPYRDVLVGLSRLSLAIHGQREARGYLDESICGIGHHAAAVRYRRRGGLWRASDVIQECSLAANAAIARYFLEHRVACLFRNQVPGWAGISYQEVMQAAAIVKSGREDSEAREAREVLEAVWKPATFDVDNEGHFALHEPVYTRAAAPRHGHAEIVNQQCLVASLRRERAPYSLSQLRKIATNVNRSASRKMKEEHDRARTARRQRNNFPRRMSMR